MYSDLSNEQIRELIVTTLGSVYGIVSSPTTPLPALVDDTSKGEWKRTFTERVEAEVAVARERGEEVEITSVIEKIHEEFNQSGMRTAKGLSARWKAYTRLKYKEDINWFFNLVFDGELQAAVHAYSVMLPKTRLELSNMIMQYFTD